MFRGLDIPDVDVVVNYNFPRVITPNTKYSFTWPIVYKILNLIFFFIFFFLFITLMGLFFIRFTSLTSFVHSPLFSLHFVRPYRSQLFFQSEKTSVFRFDFKNSISWNFFYRTRNITFTGSDEQVDLWLYAFI